MKIVGLNVGSSSAEKNGRGGIDPETGTFDYLPIVEFVEVECGAPTYRDLGFTKVKYPHLKVHLDPEFETFTYGHLRRPGDQKLFEMETGDILFFYATLDLLPARRRWGVYIVGYFDIDHVCDVRRLTVEQIKGLKEFERNAHLKQLNPKAELDLLAKGTPDSQLYSHAIPLSHPDDTRRLNTKFEGLLTTVTERPVGGAGWHRWVLYSQYGALAEILREHR